MAKRCHRPFVPSSLPSERSESNYPHAHLPGTTKASGFARMARRAPPAVPKRGREACRPGRRGSGSRHLHPDAEELGARILTNSRGKVAQALGFSGGGAAFSQPILSRSSPGPSVRCSGRSALRNLIHPQRILSSHGQVCCGASGMKFWVQREVLHLLGICGSPLRGVRSNELECLHLASKYGYDHRYRTIFAGLSRFVAVMQMLCGLS